MSVLLQRFNLSKGMVEIHYPSEMTADDVQDFCDSVALLMRSLRRRHAGDLDAGQGPQLSENMGGGSGPRLPVSVEGARKGIIESLSAEQIKEIASMDPGPCVEVGRADTAKAQSPGTVK